MAVKFHDKVYDDIEKACVNGVADGANLVYDEILSLVLDGQKTGRVYPGPHQASARGEAFANETGNALLQTKIHEGFDGGLTAYVAGHAEYAKFLELDAYLGRPTFRPALANKSEDFVKATYNEIAKVIK
jgi:hypothetical protein